MDSHTVESSNAVVDDDKHQGMKILNTWCVDEAAIKGVTEISSAAGAIDSHIGGIREAVARLQGNMSGEFLVESGVF